MNLFSKLFKKKDNPIPQQQSNPQIERFLGQLNSSNTIMKIDAADALGTLGDRRATMPLIKLLKDPAWNVRGVAAEALGKLRDAQAVEYLITIAENDESQSTRIHAIDALGKLGSDLAIETLIKLLRDKDLAIGHHAVESLEDIGGEQAAMILIDFLQSNYGNFIVVIRSLGRMGSKQAIDPISKFLEYNADNEVANHYINIAAVNSLAQLGDMRGLDILLNKLDFLTQGGQFIKKYPLEPLNGRAGKISNKENSELRSYILKVLATIGDPKSKPMVSILLEDAYVSVQEKAKLALDKLT